VNFRIVLAILKKDFRSLSLLVLLATALFAGDVFITKLELLSIWSSFRMPLVLLASTVLILSVFQLDSPVSLVDDWLCRPVPRRELLFAKLLLVFSILYFSRVIATLVADLLLGLPLLEALQDAVLLQDMFFQLVLPVLLITAVVTSNLIQGIGVLIALFVCVFMIPTPLIRPPGPLNPGIGDALGAAGMGWLTTVPAKLVPMFLVALSFWLVYWRRRIVPARALLVLATAVTLLFVALPMWLLPWRTTYALQSASLDEAGKAGRDIIDPIRLRSPRVCFPATRVGTLTADATFNAARQFNGLQQWDDGELRDLGADSLTFLTGIEVASLPLDWRVKLNYVQADYRSGEQTLYSLRPAIYITDSNGGGLLSHAWVLPEAAVRDLAAQPNASLTLAYSLTLLRPRTFQLATDGKHHALPGLGYCSAKVNSLGNSIDVDCFSTSRRAAQFSAELNGIPASRAYSSVDLAPSWAKVTHSLQFTLSIASPRLAQHDSVAVTTWEAAAYLDKSLTLPGILGADANTCPLPTRDSAAFRQSSWRDAAPHETYSISVDEGVQLEVLDFGGKGSPVLLLPGLGATAHTFDDFAPLLAKNHRVIAMTRRGTGYSSKPDFDFDTPRLAQDVLRVMDAMQLQRVLLVGSSIAGDELTWLGGHHPERFAGLVYLDAAYDRSSDPNASTARRIRELNRSLPPEPPTPPQALADFDAISTHLKSRGHLPYPEGELIALLHINNPFLAGTPSIDARTQQAIQAAIKTPDYAAIKVPALSIYAFANPGDPLPPWYNVNDKQLLANLAELGQLSNALKRESIEQFRTQVPGGRVLEMRNARHMIYQSNAQEVLQAIERFATDVQGAKL
jgi:non-heme chloroperoxidase